MHGRSRALAALALALAVFVTAAFIERSDLLASDPQSGAFTGGCERGALEGNGIASSLGAYASASLSQPRRIRAVAVPRRRGACAVRVEVRTGDGGDVKTDRSEFANPRRIWKNGQEWWYALSFMLGSPAFKPGGRDGWLLLHQFFAGDVRRGLSGGSPPLAIEATPRGKIVLTVRGGSKADAGDRAPRQDFLPVARAVPRVWHDLLIHVKWSTGSDGLVEAWHSRPGRPFARTPDVRTTGPNVLTVGGVVLPVYPETGIYRSRQARTLVVYHGGLWARTSRRAAAKFFAATARDEDGDAVPGS